MEELGVADFLKIYSENINTRFDGRIINLKGFYRRKSSRNYGEYYYDEFFCKESGYNLTLKLTEALRDQISEGKNYSIRGFINRSVKPEKDSRISLHFNLVEIKHENKEVKLVKEEEYDLIKSRFERGFIDIEELILNKFESGNKVSLLIITGVEAIVDQDFYSEFDQDDSRMFDVEILRTNLSNPLNIIEFINEIEVEEYDIVAFMRGGGSGIDVFDDQNLCQHILDLEIPFITALGHKSDNVMLNKLSDKSVATPTALGIYLHKMLVSYENRYLLIKSLEGELQQKEIEVSVLLEKNRKSRKLKVWIVILIFIVLILVYRTLNGTF